jgi:proline iminopeptidase
MDEGFLDILGNKIWYAAYGRDKPGMPLLMVHGGPGQSSMPELACGLWENRPVYCYDQLGSKRSPPANKATDYSLGRFAEELAEVITALRLPALVLAGFSWGCAPVCACVLDRKPAAVRGLILSAPYLSTPLWNADQEVLIRALPPRLRDAVWEGERTGIHNNAYREAVAVYYDRHYCRLKPWPRCLMEAFAALNTQVYWQLWGRSEFAVTGELLGLDLMPRLGEIHLPALFTCGDSDMARVPTVNAYREALPGSRLAVIPGTSHLHMLEKPALWRAAAEDFMDGLT